MLQLAAPNIQFFQQSFFERFKPQVDNEEAYCYSLCGERFHGEYSTREEALEMGRDATDPDSTVSTGRVIKAASLLPEDGWAQDIEERLENCLAEEIGWDDAIVELSRRCKGSFGQDDLYVLVAECDVPRLQG